MVDNFKKVVGGITEKTKTVKDSTKLKIDVSSAKKEIQDLYIELGKSACEMVKNGTIEEDVITGYSEKIDELTKLIEDKNEEFSKKTTELKDDFVSMGSSAKEYIRDTAADAKDFFEEKKDDLGETFDSVGKKIKEQVGSVKESLTKEKEDVVQEAEEIKEEAEEIVEEAEEA